MCVYIYIYTYTYTSADQVMQKKRKQKETRAKMTKLFQAGGVMYHASRIPRSSYGMY